MARTVGLIPKGNKKREPKNDGGNGTPKVTKAEVIEKLKTAGVEFDEKAKLEDLKELLKAVDDGGNGTPNDKE